MEPTIPTLLRDCALFASLDDGEIASLARHTARRALRARQILFHQGDDAAAVYLVEQGHLKLSKTDEAGARSVLAFVGPGEIFAVIAAMQITTYPVTAEALAAVRLLIFPRAALAEVMARHPQVAFEAMREVSSRMRDLQQRFQELAGAAVPQRLARTLLRLADDRGRDVEAGREITVPLSRQDLAELTGASLFTVSRTLASWAGEGLIGSGRRRLVVRRRERLEAIAAA